MATDVFLEDVSLKGLLYMKWNKLSEAFLMSTWYSMLQSLAHFLDVYGVKYHKIKEMHMESECVTLVFYNQIYLFKVWRLIIIQVHA